MLATNRATSATVDKGVYDDAIGGHWGMLKRCCVLIVFLVSYAAAGPGCSICIDGGLSRAAQVIKNTTANFDMERLSHEASRVT